MVKSAYAPQHHHRRSIRLPEYDYAQPGAYFVTIVTHGREPLFGGVVDGRVVLSKWREIIEKEWQRTAVLRPYVCLDAFVVMPNHVHAILWIVNDADIAPAGAQRRCAPTTTRVNVEPASLGAIVRSFKSVCARRINALRGTPGAPVWQRNYWERVIRDERECNRIRAYVESNPARWETDPENPSVARPGGR